MPLDFKMRCCFSVNTTLKSHYRNVPIEKRRPWKLGYPLGFASSNKVSKTTAIFRCRQISERRISNFSLTPLSRQYRYNRRINHCFEVSKCRFHRQRLRSVKYLICEMKRIPSWLKHYKQSKRCPSRGTNVKTASGLWFEKLYVL